MVGAWWSSQEGLQASSPCVWSWVPFGPSVPTPGNLFLLPAAGVFAKLVDQPPAIHPLQYLPFVVVPGCGQGWSDVPRWGAAWTADALPHCPVSLAGSSLRMTHFLQLSSSSLLQGVAVSAPSWHSGLEGVHSPWGYPWFFVSYGSVLGLIMKPRDFRVGRDFSDRSGGN